MNVDEMKKHKNYPLMINLIKLAFQTADNEHVIKLLEVAREKNITEIITMCENELKRRGVIA